MVTQKLMVSSRSYGNVDFRELNSCLLVQGQVTYLVELFQKLYNTENQVLPKPKLRHFLLSCILIENVGSSDDGSHLFVWVFIDSMNFNRQVWCARQDLKRKRKTYLVAILKKIKLLLYDIKLYFPLMCIN